MIKIETRGQTTKDSEGRRGDGCSSGTGGGEKETDIAANRKRQEREMRSEK